MRSAERASRRLVDGCFSAHDTGVSVRFHDRKPADEHCWGLRCKLPSILFPLVSQGIGSSGVADNHSDKERVQTEKADPECGASAPVDEIEYLSDSNVG